MDLFVLLFAAAASSLVLASPGIEAAPQYYYPPPYNYYENYEDYNNHYYPLDRIAPAPEVREERLKPEEIMESAQEYAKMTRDMADFIDTKGPDFLSLLGSENQQGNGPFHLLSQKPPTQKCSWKEEIEEGNQSSNILLARIEVGRKLLGATNVIKLVGILR